MFKVVSERTFTHEVEVLTPVDGGYEKQVFKATFLFIPLDEAKSIDMSQADDVTAFLQKVVRRFDDLEDANGNTVPYSDALRDRLIMQADVRTGLVRAFGRAIDKVNEGN